MSFEQTPEAQAIIARIAQAQQDTSEFIDDILGTIGTHFGPKAKAVAACSMSIFTHTTQALVVLKNVSEAAGSRADGMVFSADGRKTGMGNLIGTMAERMQKDHVSASVLMIELLYPNEGEEKKGEQLLDFMGRMFDRHTQMLELVHDSEERMNKLASDWAKRQPRH